jgi:hypothetical protein
MNKRYLLIARHGKSDAYGRVNGSDEPKIPLAYKDRPLSNSEKKKTGGVWETREVAAGLREACKSPSAGDTVAVGEIWSGTHRCTMESAAILAEALGRLPTPREELNPENFGANGSSFWLTLTDLVRFVKGLRDENNSLANALVRSVEGLKDETAILVVGHEPQLDHLQAALCRGSIPLRNSELVCIEVSGERRGRLLWVLSPSGDEKTLLELKQKIRSKMATAKLLGALISALLGFSLAALIEKERFARLEYLQTVGMMKLAVGFLFASMGLYLLTMYAYDTLLMPVRLWTHDKPAKRPDWLVARPPSAATHIIYLNMMHIWKCLFTPATWAVVLGLLCLACAVFGRNPLPNLPGGLGRWFSAHSDPAIGALIALAVGLLYLIGRPVLGSRD